MLTALQGRYLPAFASYVYDQNTVALAEGRDTLNMSSVIIGNGIVDIMMCVFKIFPGCPYTGCAYNINIGRVYLGRYEIECGTAAFDVPFQSISNCVHMKTTVRDTAATNTSGPLTLLNAYIYSSRAARQPCNKAVLTSLMKSVAEQR